MKGSQFLASIISQPWFILPSEAEAHLPLIASYLRGETVEVDEKGPLTIGMISPGAAYVGHAAPWNAEDYAGFPEDTVAVVSLQGALTKYDGMCHYGASSYANVIHQLADMKNVTGMVLHIDGPGGAVNGIAPLTQAINHFKATGKPIVAHADTVASAHYYIAVSADHIMMDNRISSQAGSIGVLQEMADYKEYFEKQGIKVKRIYAPESTHKNRPYEKALEGDETELKEKVLSPLAQSFQAAVRAARGEKLKEKEADGLLNGAMFFAEDAVKYGLADSIGGMDAAVQKVFDLIEVNKYMHT